MPNLFRMYVTIRSRMSSIRDVIRPELSKLSALELENLPYLTLFTLASANINQSASNLVTIYITIRSWMSSIMVVIGTEHPVLFTLELGKIAEFDFIYTLASIDINQSVPNFFRMYVTLRSRISTIMDVIRPELSKLPLN